MNFRSKLLMICTISLLAASCGSNNESYRPGAEVKTSEATPMPEMAKSEDVTKPPSAKIETLTDFEHSPFYLTQYKLRKKDGWPLTTGGFNNDYEILSIPHVSVEVETIKEKVLGIGISFFERDNLQPDDLQFVFKLLESLDTKVKLDAKIEESIKTKAEQHVFQIKQAAPIHLSTFTVFVGKVGGQQTISIETAYRATRDYPTREKYGIAIGTTADEVLAKRGKANQTIQLGSDESGLLVSWVYADATYVMGRRERDGVTAYRVIEIR